jgi:hypothetical protein
MCAWNPPSQEEIWEGAIRVRQCFEEMATEPFLVGRNGTIEIECLFFYITQRRGSGEPKPYPPRIVDQMQRNAGVFPGTNSALDRWCRSYLESLSWLRGTAAGWYKPLWHLEQSILTTFAPSNCFRTPLRSLEPYYQPPEFRWTPHLAGQHVAVVSSFAETISRQVWGEHMRDVWTGQQKGLLDLSGVTWEFIRTGYAPVTALGTAGWPEGIKDWEEAVNQVVDKVIRSGAKVALIGCGGLGMIIGARLRERGVSAIVLGGAIQVLFGMKGKRWAAHDVISKFWNDAWVWPAANETPGAANFIESGCYWG